MTDHIGAGDLSRSLEFRFYYFTARYDDTVAFYRDVLQLRVHHSWDHGAEARGTIFRAPNGSGLIEIEAGAGLPALTGGFYIEVPELEAWYARVRDQAHRSYRSSGRPATAIGISRRSIRARSKSGSFVT